MPIFVLCSEQPARESSVGKKGAKLQSSSSNQRQKRGRPEQNRHGHQEQDPWTTGNFSEIYHSLQQRPPSPSSSTALQDGYHNPFTCPACTAGAELVPITLPDGRGRGSIFSQPSSLARATSADAGNAGASERGAGSGSRDDAGRRGSGIEPTESPSLDAVSGGREDGSRPTAPACAVAGRSTAGVSGPTIGGDGGSDTVRAGGGSELRRDYSERTVSVDVAAAAVAVAVSGAAEDGSVGRRTGARRPCAPDGGDEAVGDDGGGSGDEGSWTVAPSRERPTAGVADVAEGNSAVTCKASNSGGGVAGGVSHDRRSSSVAGRSESRAPKGSAHHAAGSGHAAAGETVDGNYARRGQPQQDAGSGALGPSSNPAPGNAGSAATGFDDRGVVSEGAKGTDGSGADSSPRSGWGRKKNSPSNRRRSSEEGGWDADNGFWCPPFKVRWVSA